MATQKKSSAKKKPTTPGVFDYLRFGESYTSLALGIVVVIIGTILLLSLVRARNVARPSRPDIESSQSTTKISQTETETVISTVDEKTKSTLVLTTSPTAKPTTVVTPKEVVIKSAKPTATQVPTKAPNPTKTVEKPTAKPTAIVAVKPAKIPAKERTIKGGEYIVKSGDDLWSIAEKHYKSGYNWVDIARANKLSNPNEIQIGAKLSLPTSVQKNESSEPEWVYQDTSSTKTSIYEERITGGSYIVQKGDNLWSIAVRAYGDGYRWVKLQEANKIVNPDIIIPGMKLNIPQK